MLSFKQYLAEKERTPERSHKLLDYIADRHGGDKNEIPFKDYRYYGDPDPGYHRDEHMFDYRGVQRFHVNDLIPGQSSFSHTGVSHYLRGEGDKDIPITVIKHKYGHVIVNGHHRYMTARMLGKHIKAHVYEPNEHYRDEQEYNIKV